MGTDKSKPLIYSIPITEGQENESEVFRHPKWADSLYTTYSPQVNTIYDGLKLSFRRCRNRPFLGSRPYLQDNNYGDFEFLSYRDVDHLTRRVATKLRQICPIKNVNRYRMQSVCIWARNCPNWAIVDISAERQGITVVPIYDSLTDDSIAGVLFQTEVEAMFVANDCCDRLVKFLAIYKTQLKHIVTFGEISEQLQECFAKFTFQVWEFDTLRELEPSPDNPPTPDTIATMTYTSGSSGTPKLVVLTQKALLASATGALALGITHKPKDIAISYLSYSHLFERSLFCLQKISGWAIGYASGNGTLMQDIAILKPTWFHWAPRLYNYLYEKFYVAIEELPTFRKILVKYNLEHKMNKLQQQNKYDTYDTDFILRLRQILGGNVRFLITGSAPMQAKVTEFFKVIMKCPFIETYGLTETSGLATATQAGDVVSGHVGGPSVNLEMKLVDLPDLGYTCRDIVNGSLVRRGEVLLRGPIGSTNYFGHDSLPDIQDSSGWIKTGDIGQILQNGQLMIIDRKKSAFKLSQGEYIFPDRLENMYWESQYIEQIFMDGNPYMSYPVAVVYPNFELLKEKFNKPLSVNEMWTNASSKTLIVQELLNIAKKNWLKTYEKIPAVYITNIPFTVDNGLLTPTYKINRHYARKHFERHLKALYAKSLSKSF